MKQIAIYDLLPLLKKGWVAMDKDGTWGRYRVRPYTAGSIRESFWTIGGLKDSSTFYCFKIEKLKGDWRDSLIKVEHKEEE